MQSAQSEPVLDFSTLDPDTITSSSTPRLNTQSKTQTASGSISKMATKFASPGAVEHRDDEDTAYSVHLSAFGHHTADSTLELDRMVAESGLEEFGGPSDFTQHMAEWMRHSPKVTAPVTGDEPKASGNPSTSAELNPQNKDVGSENPGGAATISNVLAELNVLRSRCEKLQVENKDLAAALRLHVSSLKPHTPQAEARKGISIHGETEAADTASRAAVAQTQQQEIEALTRHLQSERELRRQDMLNAASREAKLNGRIESLQRALQSSTQLSESAVASINISNPNNQDVHPAKDHVRPTQYAQKQSGDPSLLGSAAETKQLRIAELEQEARSLQGQLAHMSKTHGEEVTRTRKEHDEMTRAVDDWLVQELEKRTASVTKTSARKDKKIGELEGQVDKLKRLNDQCGKELMLAWGREEFGPAGQGERQRYRYKYAVHLG